MARSNTFFRFKQFTIHQERCAMKVGTDGVLLGAWANVKEAQRILDVGTGTGLIALMLAQRTAHQTTPAQIDAIEIDEAASQQARENVTNSPWPERVQVYHYALQEYMTRSINPYDLIIANPPFFEKAHKAANPARSLARHNDTLTHDDLLDAACQLLTAKGCLSVIYPTEIAQHFLTRADTYGFVCQRKLRVKPTPMLPVKRILVVKMERHSYLKKNGMSIRQSSMR